MKYIFFIFLSSATLFSQNDYILGQNELAPSPQPPNERNTDNLLLVILFDDPKAMIPSYDDYSWVQEFATEESFELVSNIKREGVSSGRFQLNKNDPDIAYSKRAEMSQRKEIVQPEGWYGFSNFFPSSYTSDPTPEIVAQWHDLPDFGEETDRSNSNSIMVENGKLIWQVRWDTRFLMPDNIPEGLLNIVIGDVPKNKWIDWVVHIKYSHTNTGILEVWMDGEKVIDRQNMPNSYNDKAYPFFKFGIYKWKWGTATSQRVIYYDEVRVGDENSSYDKVNPGR